MCGGKKVDRKKKKFYNIFMKRKILSFILSLLVAFSLWAQNPTKSFPYYYYTGAEKSWSSYNCSYVKTIRDNSTWTVYLYESSYNDYIVFRYKKSISEKKIKNTLDRDASIWKNYDHKNGSSGVCLVVSSPGSR